MAPLFLSTRRRVGKLVQHAGGIDVVEFSQPEVGHVQK
jgi:hypothetical protein